MKNHFSLQGNFTWDKVMLHTAYSTPFDTTLTAPRVRSGRELHHPRQCLRNRTAAHVPVKALVQRETLGGWQFNGVFRAAQRPA